MSIFNARIRIGVKETMNVNQNSERVPKRIKALMYSYTCMLQAEFEVQGKKKVETKTKLTRHHHPFRAGFHLAPALALMDEW